MTECEGGSVRKWLIVMATLAGLYVIASLILDQLSKHELPAPSPVARLAELGAGALITTLVTIANQEISNRKSKKRKRKRGERP